MTPVNDPPVVSDIPDQTVDEDSSFATITLDNYVSDIDNADEQLTWTYSGNTDLLVDITDRVVTIIVPDSEWNGSESITFRATDPDGLFDEDAALFTVTPVNDPPIVSDIPDQYIGPGETFAPINLDEYVTDIDNDLSELTWTYSGNDALAVDITDHVANVSVPDDQWSGSETIIFRAIDPDDGFGEDAAVFTRGAQGNCCLEHGIPGDANADGSVNLLDILRLIDVIYDEPAGEPHNEIGCDALYDANGSGLSVDSPEINLLDVLYLINAIYDDPSGLEAPCCPPGCQTP